MMFSRLKKRAERSVVRRRASSRVRGTDDIDVDVVRLSSARLARRLACVSRGRVERARLAQPPGARLSRAVRSRGVDRARGAGDAGE